MVVETGTNNPETLTGSELEDTLIGLGGNDFLEGLGGNDSLDGGDDNDTIFGGLGQDTLRGGDGNDELNASNESGFDSDPTLSDELYGGEGNDTLNGFGSNAMLFGGAGEDSLLGGPDGLDDTLDGGTGADDMIGQGGSDVYFVDNIGDSVSEFTYNSYGPDNTATGDVDEIRATLSWVLDQWIDDGYNVENLTLLGSDDLNATGNEVGNVILGNAGNNLLSGEEGADTLIGGDGNDTLIGGLGNDTFTGSDGADTFVMTAGGGDDVVTDFNAQLDRVSVDGFTPAELEAATQTVDAEGNRLISITSAEGTTTLLLMPPPNAAPVFTSTSPTTADEDALFSYAVSATDADGDQWDFDEDASTLPSWADFGAPGIIGTPDQDDVGFHDFVVAIADGNGGITTQSFSVEVLNVNDDPVSTDRMVTTAEDMALTFDLATGVVDEDGDLLTYTIASQPDHGLFQVTPEGIATYTPTENYFGPDQFDYRVTDPSGASSTSSVDVTVTSVNDPPVIVPLITGARAAHDLPFTFDLIAFDDDGDPISFDAAASTLPDWLSHVDGLTFTGTPTASDVGENTLLIAVTDGEDTSEVETITFTVHPLPVPADGLVNEGDTFVHFEDTPTPDQIFLPLPDNASVLSQIAAQDISFEVISGTATEGEDFTISYNLGEQQALSVTALTDSLVEDDETVLVRVSGYIDWIVPTIAGEDILNLQGTTVQGQIERSFVDFSVNTTINSAPTGTPDPVSDYSFRGPEVITNVLTNFSDGSGETFSVEPFDVPTGNLIVRLEGNGDLTIMSAVGFEGAEIGLEFRVFDERGASTTSLQRINFTLPPDDFLPGDAIGVFGQVDIGTPTTGNIDRSGDRDRFEVTLQAGVIYDISLKGVDSDLGTLLDPEIYGVFDATGAFIAGSADDNSGFGNNAQLTDFSVDVDGVYQIEAGAAGIDGLGDYTLSVTQVGFIDDYLPGVAGGFGTVVPGTSTTGEIETSGDIDGFSVTLEDDTTYRISILGSGSNAGTLLDPDLLGVFASSDLSLDPVLSVQTLDTVSSQGDSISYFTPSSAGAFFIGVQDATGGTGTYTVNIEDIGVRDDFAADIGTTGSIAAGGTANGRVDFALDQDWFETILAAGRLYEIKLDSAAGTNALADPFFRGVYDSNGVVIPDTENDDIAVGQTNSSVQFVTDEDGTFYLAAGGFDTTIGEYSLELSDLGPLDDNTFDITIDFGSDDVPSDYVNAFAEAVALWEQVIIGDLEYAFVQDYGYVDDILIEVEVQDDALAFDGLDGEILSISTVLGQRESTVFGEDALPTHAQIILDTSAIGNTLNLEDIAANAIGRALGFGSLWEEFGLVQTFGGVATYVGPNALREAAELSPNLDGQNILEDGSNGLAAQYWSKALLDSELMTSRVELRRPDSGPGNPFVSDNPLTTLTIAAMEDLGYVVNYDSSYVPPLPPVVENDTITTDEDTSINFSPLNNDSDPEGGTLTIVEVSQGSRGGTLAVVNGTTLEYAPVSNANGNALEIASYTVEDEQGLQSTGLLTFNVTPVNDAPNAAAMIDGINLITQQEQTFFIVGLGELGIDDDGIDQSTVTYQWLRNGVEIPGATQATYLTTSDDYGTSLSAEYRYTDNGGTEEVVRSGSVPVSRATPEITSTAPTTVTEDAAFSYTITTEDLDGDGVTFDASASTLPAWLSFDGVDTFSGLISSVGPNDPLNYAFTIAVKDDSILELVGTQSFDLQVVPVNDAPVIASIPDASSEIGEAFSLTITTTDEEGDAVTVDLGQSTLPDWLSFDGDRTFSGTPDAEDVAQNTVVIAVEDAQGATAEQEFDLTVVNPAPGQTVNGTNLLDDTLSGGQGPDYLRGGLGDDVLRALGGDDLLQGDAGNDTLFGGEGADMLIGGTGNNVLIGGAGSDTFVVTPGSTTRILDFEEGIDRIVIENMSSSSGQNTLVPAEVVFGTAALGPFSNLIVSNPGDGGGTVLTAFDKDELQTTVELNVPNANNPVFEGSEQVSTNPLFESRASLLNSVITLSGTAQEVFESANPVQDPVLIATAPQTEITFFIDPISGGTVGVGRIVNIVAGAQIGDDASFSDPVTPFADSTFEETFNIGLAKPLVQVPLVDSLAARVPPDALDAFQDQTLDIAGDTLDDITANTSPDPNPIAVTQTTKLTKTGNQVNLDSLTAEVRRRDDDAVIDTSQTFFDNDTGMWFTDTPENPRSGTFEQALPAPDHIDLAADPNPVNIEITVDVEGVADATGMTAREVVQADPSKSFLRNVDFADLSALPGEVNLVGIPSGSTLTSDLGSFIFDIDLDSNGVIDITVKIEGDFDDARFRTVELEGGTLGVSPFNGNADPLGAVAITGVLLVGEILTANLGGLFDADGIDAATVTYQWLRDGAEVAGATQATYELTAADADASLSVAVTYTDDFDTVETISSAETRDVASQNSPVSGALGITGTAGLFEILSVSTDTLEDLDGVIEGSAVFQWFSNGQPIAGEIAPQFLILPDHLGTEISVQLTFRDGNGTTEIVTSAPLAVASIIEGTGTDDQLNGTSANDLIDGLDGQDALTFTGARDDYTITLSAQGIFINDRRVDGDGFDQIDSIEELDFLDQSFNLFQFSDVTDLSEADFTAFIEMYIAYFNRAPDAEGLLFWANALSKGIPLETIANLFFEAPETKALYGEEITDFTAFAKQVYSNVLGREFDQTGLDFWVGVLEAGAIPLGNFMLNIIGGAKVPSPPDATPEFIAQKALDVQYLSDKTDLGAYFSAIKGMSNTDDAIAAMSLFDGSAASVIAAKDAIDGFFADASAADGEFLISVVGVVDDPFAI